MSKQLKNLELGIDSSLSYCSITLFKNKKIFWDRFQKNDFGHEKNLSLMLQKMLIEMQITPKNISFLHLNNGPARFTAIRNCHALMKGFFFGHKVKIFSYKIFEHYFLGINQSFQNKKTDKNMLLYQCVKLEALAGIDSLKKDQKIKNQVQLELLSNKFNKSSELKTNDVDSILRTFIENYSMHDSNNDIDKLWKRITKCFDKLI